MADRHNVIFEAARLHFEEGLKQDDVARRLRVSRPTAARYLAMAKEMGYVHIRVLDPKGHAYLHDLEIALTEKYPRLREVILTSSRPESLTPGHLAARRAVADEMAERAAGRVDYLLTSRRRNEPPVVAVARGEMIDNVIRHIRPSRPLPELEVLPMLGYLRSREYPYDANRLAQELARIYSGNYEWIPAPAVVTDEEAAVVRNMPLVAAPLGKLSEDVNVVLTSLSCPHVTNAKGETVLREQTLLQSGRVEAEAIRELVVREQAVGEICGWYYNDEKIIMPPGVDLLGLSPERQREMAADAERSVIGVAGGDPDRFGAVRAAIRLGLINVLVTDYLTAHRLLEQAG